MATEVGSAFVSVVPSTRGFGGTLSKQIAGPSTKAGQVSGGRFRTGILGSLRGIGGVLAGSLALGAGVNFFKEAISGASDLNETVSKVGVVFGKGALPGLERFAGGAATALGQSKQEALDGAATFGIFGKSAGLTGQKLSGFSTGLVSLAGDMASFSNTTPAEATEALGAALRGESEPIRKYGVLLDDATLRNEALKLGLISTTKTALTPQQKVLAAQASIYKQTHDAQGDFARTSGGLANQQRILSATFKNTKTQLGAAFLPIAVKVVTFLNTHAMPVIARLAASFGDRLGPALAGASPLLTRIGGLFKLAAAQVGRFVAGLQGSPQASASFTSIGASLSELGPALLEAAKQLPSFNSVLHVGATVIGFFADHADLLAKSMPFLIAGLAAYTAAQVISNTVGRNSLIGFVAQTTATFALAASNFALSGAMRAQAASQVVANAGQNAGTLASIRQRIAIIATAIAQKVAAAATKVWAATQWLLNAALTANPIGLVVVAIAALVTGVILAYRHSETFRRIVHGAFTVLKTVVLSTLPVLRRILAVVVEVGAGIGRFAVRVVRFFLRIHQGVVAKVRAVITFLTAMPAKIVAAVGNLGRVLFNAGRDIITGLVNGIKGKFVDVKNTLTGLTGKLTSWKGPASKDATILEKPGQLLIQGFMAGIDSQAPALKKKLQGITKTIPKTVGIGRPVGARQADIRHAGGGGAGGTVHLTVNNPLPERAAESTANSLRRLSWTHGLAVA